MGWAGRREPFGMIGADLVGMTVSCNGMRGGSLSESEASGGWASFRSESWTGDRGLPAVIGWGGGAPPIDIHLSWMPTGSAVGRCRGKGSGGGFLSGGHLLQAAVSLGLAARADGPPDGFGCPPSG